MNTCPPKRLPPRFTLHVFFCPVIESVDWNRANRHFLRPPHHFEFEFCLSCYLGLYLHPDSSLYGSCFTFFFCLLCEWGDGIANGIAGSKILLSVVE